MGIPSFRHSVIPSLVGVLMLTLSSCNPPPAIISTEPTLRISSHQSTFRKGDNLAVEIELYSPTDTDVNVIIGASEKLGLTQNKYQITLNAGQAKTIELQGTLKRAGYYNITANVTGTTWHEPVASMFGFNVDSSSSNTRQTTSGLETLETHLDNLPKITTPEAYSQLSTAQVIDDAKNLDGVRLDSRLENVTFDNRDGTKSEPFNTVLTYLPDTGSGQPRPEDLVPPTAAQKAKAKPRGIGCNLGVTATVTAKISYSGKTQILPYTKISVWDENPWLKPSLIKSGFTDANGTFSFQKPDCDWGAWWDYSGPDIYFIVESKDNHEIGVWNILAPIYNFTYSVATGTNWDTTATSFNASFNAGNSDSENALWLYRMVQMAEDYNVAAGGAGATYFPMRTSWPSRTLGVVNNSFAALGKLEIFGPHWLIPYIAWHEFGHELMYRTSNPSQFMYTYDQGAFTIFFPNFAWGSHNYNDKQHFELAYNDGFANYFYVLMQDYYNFDFNQYASDSYYFRECSNITAVLPLIPEKICDAYRSGDENESRVSTFLYRYTQEVLVPANGNIGAQSAFGLIRSKLWNVGYYNTNLSTAWNNWLKVTLPSANPYLIKTKKIATETFFSLAGLP